MTNVSIIVYSIAICTFDVKNFVLKIATKKSYTQFQFKEDNSVWSGDAPLKFPELWRLRQLVRVLSKVQRTKKGLESSSSVWRS